MAGSSVNDSVVELQTDRSAKDKIIKSARTLMAKLGYSAVSINDVALETGISKSTVYHYFRSKNELVLAAIALEDKEFRAIFTPLHSKTTLSPEEAFTQILGILQNYFSHPKEHLLTSMAHKAESIATNIADALRHMLNAWHLEIEKLFHTHAKMDSKTAKQETSVLITKLFGALLLSKLYKTSSFIEEACARVPSKIKNDVSERLISTI